MLLSPPAMTDCFNLIFASPLLGTEAEGNFLLSFFYPRFRQVPCPRVSGMILSKRSHPSIIWCPHFTLYLWWVFWGEFPATLPVVGNFYYSWARMCSSVPGAWVIIFFSPLFPSLSCSGPLPVSWWSQGCLPFPQGLKLIFHKRSREKGCGWCFLPSLQWRLLFSLRHTHREVFWSRLHSFSLAHSDVYGEDSVIWYKLPLCMWLPGVLYLYFRISLHWAFNNSP